MVGIDAKNRHLLDTKYICPVCLLILRNPIQWSKCGHRQCQSCVDDQHAVTIKCPQCQFETLRVEMLFDRGFQNDMKSIPIDCAFCEWSGILNNYQKHLDESHANPKCEYCDKEFNSVNKCNEHKVSECQKLIVDCILKDFGCNEQV
ncbi:unnamed protein product [Rotaria sp. Silwood1]|nr:unnamed protein product [Rotaria sp. Silwood1]CAF1445260.1 unnamed protein product [Rotaria sp. Silwood1]CAF1448262.1 unnamed protein product [Rotaria sp. Silwood1]CAF3608602.1 unnamed protein product [Rotaria sp. Silwood1]CAF3635564.1 unnamed protein product [Rotaria sp. Silwood1]